MQQAIYRDRECSRPIASTRECTRPHQRVRAAIAVAALGALLGCGSGGGGSASPAQASLSAPPAAVTGLVATVGNSPTVTLSWNPSAGADSYVIYWSESQGVTPTNGAAIREAQTPHLQDGLTAGKRYHYVVTAVNAAGESAPSAEVSAVLTPASPTGVSALSGDSSNTVSWQSVPHAERYRVYWSTQAGVGKSNGTMLEANASPLTHLGLQNGTPYYYVVTAIGAGGEGPVSQQVSATPRVPVPGAPRDLTVQLSPDTARTMVLAWLAPAIPANSADILRYRIYRSTQPEIASNPAAATLIEASTQTSYTDPVPLGGVTYYYVVTAITVAGESAPSAEVSATASSDSGDGGGSGSGTGGGGSFDCGEPVACWQDTTTN